jgi:vancomycin resistance protein YoaR
METLESNIDSVQKSGPETILPWQNDMEFVKAQEKSKTPVLMAAYRTVLRDPLPGEEYNVHLAARMLDGIIVEPGAIFSQNQAIGPYIESRGFQKGPTYIGTKLTTTIGGGVCKIASTLYNVTVLSNLKVVERYNHSMPVPYVPYGQDATVAYGVKDFRFQNDTSFPIMIWAQGIDNILYIAFYGSSSPPKIEWHHETVEHTKAPVAYKDNPDLPAGTEKMVLEGMDGALVKSWISIENTDGTTVTRELGKSFYNPMPSIIERGR